MYRIIAYDSPTDKTGHVVFDPRINRYISDGKLTLVENAVDNMTLTVNFDNWLYGTAKPFVTHIEVYEDESLIFRGRCIQVTRQMKENGEFLQTFVFEDILNYLKDSIQRHLKVQNMTVRQFLQKLIDVHNSQVPEYKQFALRSVNVTNSTDNVYYYVDYVDTWETIKDKLLNRLGGVIRTDYVNGKNYIDYMTYDQGTLHQNDMQIQIGKNMQSLTVEEDPTAIITRLVPLGATIEQTDSNTDASQPRITISSVNNGQDYIDIPELQAEYGIINGENTWDDVHEPAILLTKAKKWIAQQTASKESYTITALELPQYDHYIISDRYQVVNPNVATPVYLRVIQKEINFLDWYKSTLTIGDRTSTLSEYQRENINAKKQADNLRSQTQNAVNTANKAYSSRLVGTLVESSLLKSADEDSLPLFTLKVAEDNDDFGLRAGDKFAVQTTASGVEGLDAKIAAGQVTYEVATPTSDGLMSASDKEKLNGLQQYTESTETQAGLMSPSDKEKLNKLKEEPVNDVQIKDAVTGSIYFITVQNGEIKLEGSQTNG